MGPTSSFELRATGQSGGLREMLMFSNVSYPADDDEDINICHNI